MLVRSSRVFISFHGLYVISREVGLRSTFQHKCFVYIDEAAGKSTLISSFRDCHQNCCSGPLSFPMNPKEKRHVENGRPPKPWNIQIPVEAYAVTVWQGASTRRRSWCTLHNVVYVRLRVMAHIWPVFHGMQHIKQKQRWRRRPISLEWKREKVKKQNLVRHGVMAKEIQREPQSVASSDFFSFSEECCGDEEYAVLGE